MPTIKDVAKKANVAISTVSNVINGTKFVSDDVKKRVEDAILELGYSTNYVARSMKNKRTMRLGFVALDMCGLFFPYVLKEVNKIAGANGYTITISDSNSDFEIEKKNITDLIARQVDGIIFSSIVPPERAGEYADYLKDLIKKTGKDIKLVSIERDFSSYGIDSISTDTYHGACLAVQHLISLGCTKIAHISAPVGTGDNRYQAYCETLKKNGIPFNAQMVLAGDLTHNSGYDCAIELLSRNLNIDAIFVANDQMSIGVIQALEEQGIQIPDDIKVIGFDDVFICQALNPALSSVHVEKRLLGQHSINLLLDRIEHPDNQSIHTEMLDCYLIPRKSTDVNYDLTRNTTHENW